MSRGFGHAHRDRKTVWHGPGRLTLSTHSPASQPKPWEPAPDLPTSPSADPHPLRCPPTFARSTGQAAASNANTWPAEHMGGARAATRGPESPWAMDAAQSVLYGETSPGLWWDPSPSHPRQSQSVLS